MSELDPKVVKIVNLAGELTGMSGGEVLQDAIAKVPRLLHELAEQLGVSINDLPKSPYREEVAILIDTACDAGQRWLRSIVVELKEGRRR